MNVLNVRYIYDYFYRDREMQFFFMWNGDCNENSIYVPAVLATQL